MSEQSRFIKGTECPKGLLCFPHLESGRVDDNGKEMGTSLVMAWPKEGNEAWRKRLLDIATAARNEKFGPDQKFKCPVKDADTYEDEQGELFVDKYPQLAGHFFINLGSKKPFALVGPNPKIAITAEDVVSGDIGRCAIHAYAWTYESRKGVSFGHGNIQKLEDGPVKIGGGGQTKPEDDFDDELSSAAEIKSADAALDNTPVSEDDWS